MLYTVYDQEGRTTQVINCSPSEIESLIARNPGSGYLSGAHLGKRIVNGVPELIPPCPGDHYVYDYRSGDWYDPRMPEQRHVDAQNAVRDQRAAELTRTDIVLLRALEPIALQLAPHLGPLIAYRQELRDMPEQVVGDSIPPMPTPPPTLDEVTNG